MQGTKGGAGRIIWSRRHLPSVRWYVALNGVCPRPRASSGGDLIGTFVFSSPKSVSSPTSPSSRGGARVFFVQHVGVWQTPASHTREAPRDHREGRPHAREPRLLARTRDLWPRWPQLNPGSIQLGDLGHATSSMPRFEHLHNGDTRGICVTGSPRPGAIMRDACLSSC